MANKAKISVFLNNLKTNFFNLKLNYNSRRVLIHIFSSQKRWSITSQLVRRDVGLESSLKATTADFTQKVIFFKLAK